jgi:hypothetical protein
MAPSLAASAPPLNFFPAAGLGCSLLGVYGTPIEVTALGAFLSTGTDGEQQMLLARDSRRSQELFCFDDFRAFAFGIFRQLHQLSITSASGSRIA